LPVDSLNPFVYCSKTDHKRDAAYSAFKTPEHWTKRTVTSKIADQALAMAKAVVDNLGCGVMSVTPNG